MRVRRGVGVHAPIPSDREEGPCFVRVVSVVNQKGGCGKTTTAISLAGVFAAQGHRVLLVDMDPQSHCAAGLGIPEKRIDLDISDALVAGRERPVDPARLIWRPARNLDLIPSRMKLAGLETPRGGLVERADRDQRLAEVLSNFQNDYDLCLIDCSPAIGLLTYNAMTASDGVVIPVETGFFSLQGAAKQIVTVKAVRKRSGGESRIWLVATLHDIENSLCGELFDELVRRFGDIVCPYAVRRDPRLKEAASIGKSIVQFAPESTGAGDYAMVAAWLHPRLGVSSIRNAEASSNVDPANAEPKVTSRAARENAVVSIHESIAPDGPDDPTKSEHALRPADITPSNVPTGDRTAGVEHADTPGDPLDSVLATAPMSPPEPSVGIAGQIAADLRLRARSRADEMARLAQKLAQKFPHARDESHAATSTGDKIVPPSSRPEPENFERSSRSAANLAGVRLTRQGVLFVQPISAGIRLAVAGDFNDWSVDRDIMKPNRELDVHELCLRLPPGRYQYRLVIDGAWTHDPFNPLTQGNPFGGLDSVIVVPPET
jgi:chromosome partitioning protein